jgi:cytochrome c-type protein NapC
VTSFSAVDPALRNFSGWGTALDWAIWTTVIVSALILALIILGRFRYRGAQMAPNALWFHLVALGVFPLMLLIVGNFAALEYSTTQKFCGSCHVTMQAYIADLQRPKGMSLASLHFQNRAAPDTECYSCHVNYGLHGAVQAKFTGLRHVYRYTTGTYTLPLKIYEAYPNALCLNCHDGAKRFMAESSHLDGDQVSADLRTNATECIQCHGPAHVVAKPQHARLESGGQ